MKRILARLAVLVAAMAAMVAPAALSSPAAAQPLSPTVVNCWNEIDTYKQGQTIIMYAIKDCTNLDVPQNLTLTMQINVCDEFGGGCYWVTWKSGSGVVTYTCPGTFWAAFRSSRLPSKVVYCDYF